jgi:tetratricopeptide (TPR) repeat protein
VERIAGLLAAIRQDLRHIDLKELNAEDRRRLAHAKILIAEVVRIGREEKDIREMDALSIAKLAAAEVTTVLAHQVHLNEYCALIDRYLAGDRAAIQAARLDFPPSFVEPIVGLIGLHMSELQVTGGPLEQVGPKTVLGMAMLQTEISIESGAAPAFDLPGRVLALLKGEAVPPGFHQKWYLAVLGHLQGGGYVLEAVHHADAALAAFPEDVGLLVATGALHELIASPELVPASTQVKRGVRIPTADLALMTERRRDGWKIAEKFYQHASVLDPGYAEAHLRLGWVLFLSGRSDAALSELALAERSTDRRIRYLASLFRGGVRAAAGKWTDAVAAYRNAGALYPNCLAASAGLSHAIRRSGDTANASEAMASALADDRRTPCHDPWWDYPLGAFHERDRLLEELRGEIR